MAARLPSVPRRNVTTEAARSRISPADIARPYELLAGGLDNLAAGAAAMQQAADQTKLARYAINIDNDVNAAKLENVGKPEQFKAWAEGYSREMLKNERDPTVRRRLETAVGYRENGQFNFGSTTGSAYNTLASQLQAATFDNAKKTMVERIGMLDDQMATLARDGQAGGAEYAARRDELSGLYGQLSDNPLYGVPKEVAGLALKRMESRHMGEALVGTVDGIYQAKGLGEAQKAADSILTDTSLDLTPAERRQYRTLAIGDINAAEKERRAELRLYKPEANLILERLKTGEGLDEADVDAAIATLGELGDPVTAGKLIRARATGRFVKEFAGLPDTQQLAVAREAFGGGGADAAGLLRGFESFSGTAYWDVNAYRAGFGSDTVTRADGTVEKVTKDTVVTPADAERDLQRRIGEFQSVIVGQIGQDAWNGLSEPARAALSSVAYNYGRLPSRIVPAAQSGDMAALADQIEALGGDNQGINEKRRAQEAALVRGGPRIDPQALKAIRGEITQDAKDHWSSIKAGFIAGQPPALDEMREFAGQVALVEDGDFRNEVATQLESYADGYLLGGMPPVEAQQVLDRIRTGAGEDGYTEIERDALKIVDEARNNAAQAIGEDPAGYAVQRGFAAPPAPLDFSTPESTAAALTSRERNAAIARQQFGQADVPVFSKADADAVAAAIANPQSAASALGMIASVSDDSLAPTIGMKAIKDAISGAVRGTDPDRFSAAMTALDQLWQRAPMSVQASLGSDTIDTLQDWQAKLRYYRPDELIAELKNRDDPQVRERRTRLREQGQREAAKTTVQNVVDGLDPGYFTTGPAAPIDPFTRDALMGDYETIYSDRFAMSGDKAKASEQALQRLRTKWGASPVNGGRLTLYPPEGFYPAVDGSHDWMTEQLRAEMSTFGNVPEGLTIIPDRDTDAEIQAGKPPGYMVATYNPQTAEWHLVTDTDQTPFRFHWDSSRYAQSAEAKFKAERDKVFAPSTYSLPTAGTNGAVAGFPFVGMAQPDLGPLMGGQ